MVNVFPHELVITSASSMRGTSAPWPGTSSCSSISWALRYCHYYHCCDCVYCRPRRAGCLASVVTSAVVAATIGRCGRLFKLSLMLEMTSRWDDGFGCVRVF